MRLQSIQSLRAIAALLVLVFHLRDVEMNSILRNGMDEAPLLSLGIQNGFAGVDLFFVISGFVMVYVTGAARPALSTSAAFLFARAGRIYPLWWLFAGIMVAYFLASTGTPWDVSRMEGAPPDQTWLQLVFSALLLPQESWPVYSLGWTLIHEMHFYLVFAGLLLLPRKALPYALAVWAAIAASGALYFGVDELASNYRELALNPLTLEFIAGAFAALLLTKRPAIRPGALAIIGATGLIAALLFYQDANSLPEIWGRVLWFGLPAALLIYGVAGLEASSRAGYPQWLSTLGDWSYSLYLGHLVVLLVIRRAMEAAAPQLEGTALAPWVTLGAPGPQDNLLFYGVGALLSLAVAGFTYTLIETPCMSLMRTLRRKFFGSADASLKPTRVASVAP